MGVTLSSRCRARAGASLVEWVQWRRLSAWRRAKPRDESFALPSNLIHGDEAARRQTGRGCEPAPGDQCGKRGCQTAKRGLQPQHDRLAVTSHQIDTRGEHDVQRA